MGEKEGKGNGEGSGGREREPPPSLGRGGSFVADVGGAAKKSATGGGRCCRFTPGPRISCAETFCGVTAR